MKTTITSEKDNNTIKNFMYKNLSKKMKIVLKGLMMADEQKDNSEVSIQVLQILEDYTLYNMFEHVLNHGIYNEKLIKEIKDYKDKTKNNIYSPFYFTGDGAQLVDTIYHEYKKVFENSSNINAFFFNKEILEELFKFPFYKTDGKKFIINNEPLFKKWAESKKMKEIIRTIDNLDGKQNTDNVSSIGNAFIYATTLKDINLYNVSYMHKLLIFLNEKYTLDILDKEWIGSFLNKTKEQQNDGSQTITVNLNNPAFESNNKTPANADENVLHVFNELFGRALIVELLRIISNNKTKPEKISNPIWNQLIKYIPTNLGNSSLMSSFFSTSVKYDFTKAYMNLKNTNINTDKLSEQEKKSISNFFTSYHEFIKPESSKKTDEKNITVLIDGIVSRTRFFTLNKNEISLHSLVQPPINNMKSENIAARQYVASKYGMSNEPANIDIENTAYQIFTDIKNTSDLKNIKKENKHNILLFKKNKWVELFQTFIELLSDLDNQFKKYNIISPKEKVIKIEEQEKYKDENSTAITAAYFGGDTDTIPVKKYSSKKKNVENSTKRVFYINNSNKYTRKLYE
jgi:hypothetical protein